MVVVVVAAVVVVVVVVLASASTTNIGEILDEFVNVNGERTTTKINAGLHNVSLSHNPEHKGCLWLSLQYANTLLLVDVKNLDANGAPTILNEYKAFDDRYTFLSTPSIHASISTVAPMYPSIFKVPVNLKDGCHVGGPHVIREGKHKP